MDDQTKQLVKFGAVVAGVGGAAAIAAFMAKKNPRFRRTLRHLAARARREIERADREAAERQRREETIVDADYTVKE